MLSQEERLVGSQAATFAEPEDPEERAVDDGGKEEDGGGAAATIAGGAEPDDDDVCGPSFFEEEAECKALLQRLADALPAGPSQEGGGFSVKRACELLPSLGTDPNGAASLVDRLARILDRYQESPHLLYPCLDGLVTPLVELLLRYLPSATDVWAHEKAEAQRQAQDARNARDAAAERGTEPSTLGRNYDMFDADAPKTPIHLVCHALYFIVKTAGEDACTSHFPNDVRFYEDVFYALRLWKNTGDASPAEDGSGAPASWASIRRREWEVRYCLLLWLCNLVLVPFSLGTIDSTVSAPSAAADLTSAGRIMSTDSLSDALLVMAVQFLADTSKCRDGAALLVARLLTRPDSQRHRDAFFAYGKALVEIAVTNGGASQGGEAEGLNRHLSFLTEALAADSAAHPEQHALRPFESTFLIPGVLAAMSTTLKLGQRREMLPYASGLIQSVAALQRLRSSDALLCKTAVKVVQRMVLTMLKKKSASWKYKRHDVASLAANLAMAGGQQQQQQQQLGSSNAEDQEDEVSDESSEDVVEGDGEALEEGIGLLLETLAHKDTIVRWSSATGVGRVCDRLPAGMAQEVIEAVYECFASEYDDAAWHGGLLALAELCRRSIIDAVGLDKVVPKIAKGLGFDLSKGTYSVGAHVRDAACYTCWSIARAYDASDLEKHVHQLSAALVVTALFDREVNVRRAAAAAFQECVGRLGSFPNGIALVTAMDFFSLASRANAFLQVAPVVAPYDAYRSAMLEELVGTKLLHWDRNVRQCAAGALGKIAAIEFEKHTEGGAGTSVIAAIFDELQRRVTDQTVATRHGAILGLAELVRGGLPVSFWTEEQRERLADVIVRVDQARLFRSRGGEHIRHACCQLLSASATVRLPLPEFLYVTKMSGDKARARTLGKVQEFLEETWKNILEWLQLTAADTFAAVAAAYYTTFQPAFHGKVMTKMMDATKADEGEAVGKSSVAPLERRGFLAAMGGLPACLLVAPAPTGEETGTAHEMPYFLPILRNLCAAATSQGAETGAAERQQVADPLPLGDAESRRNAVRSLAKVLATIPAGHPSLTPAVYQSILSDTLLVALQDYAVDKRGDVGSFVRIAVLQALPSVVAVGLRGETPPPLLLPGSPVAGSGTQLGLRVLQGCVKALHEKLDRVRGAAGAALVALLVEDSNADGQGAFMRLVCGAKGGCSAEEVAETEYLQALVVRLHVEQHVEWTSPRSVILSVAPPLLLHAPVVYAEAAMEGLVVAAGDLSLHVQQPSMQALLSAFRADNGEAQERLSALVALVGKRYSHTERVLIPLSRVLDRLLNEGVFAESQSQRCVAILRSELKHYATSITVVLPLVTVLATLCRSGSEAARTDAWSLALTMVASRYPKVRARMATDLYTALLVLTSSAEAPAVLGVELSAGCSKAMEHLLRVQWDANDAGKVRAARNALYGMLGLTPPHKSEGLAAGEMTAGSAKPTHTKVASTYASLVQEAGY